MPSAISRASAGGVVASLSPTRTSVGQRIAARIGRESGRIIRRPRVAQEDFGAGLFRHEADEPPQLRVSVSGGVDEQ